MKRWKSHIIEGTTKARQFVKDYIDDQIQEYKDKLIAIGVPAINEKYLSGFEQEYIDTLEQSEIDTLTKTYRDSLIPTKRKQILSKIGDSIEKCPQIGKRVAFIDPELTGNKVKQFLQLCNVIQFGRTFLYDDGNKAVPITKENYKDVDYKKWLTEVPEKYITNNDES